MQIKDKQLFTAATASFPLCSQNARKIINIEITIYKVNDNRHEK